MNHCANHGRRRTAPLNRLLTGATFCAAASLLAGAPAFGQVPPAAAPAPGASTTTPAAKPLPAPPLSLAALPSLTPTQTTTLSGHVGAVIAVATTADSFKAASDARKALTAFANTPGATPGFQVALAREIGNAVTATMKSKDVRARAAAAVILANVAATTKLPQVYLAPAIQAAMNDPFEAVAISGLKAARAVYPSFLTGNAAWANALATQAVVTVRKYHASAAVLEEAFEMISGKAVLPVVTPAGVDRMIDLIQARADLFSMALTDPAVTLPEQDAKFPAMPLPRPNAPAVPGAPEFEAGAVDYLALNAAKLTPAQRARAGRAMFELCKEMVRLAAIVIPAQAGDPPNLVRQQDIVNLLRRSMSALQVAAGTGTPAGQQAAAILKLLPGLGGGIMNPGLPDEMAKLEAEMKKAGILGEKPAIPKIAAPAAAPATAPARPPAAKPTGPTIAPARPAAAPAGGVPAVAPAPGAGNGAKPGGAALNK